MWARLLVLLTFAAFKGYASTDSLYHVHADLPQLDDQRYLTVDVYYSAVTAQAASLHYSCYKYDAKGDSVLICRKQAKSIGLDGSLYKQHIVFAGSEDGPAYYLPVFYNILRKTGVVAPGQYKVFLQLRNDSSRLITSRVFTHQVDSSLPPTSPLRKELATTLVPDNKARIAGVDLSKEARAVNNVAANTTKALDHAAGRIDRLFKARGLTPVTQKRDGKEYISLYYEDWFVGRYEVELSKSLSAQVQQQQSALTAPVASLATNELEGYRSLFSQVKDLLKQKKEERELTGQIGLTGNWANRQPEYAAEDNNYYELRGNIETTVQDIPIGIEGYYTTQDRNRSVKASYIRVHYDADKAKGQLMTLINGFKNQCSQTLSKGQGLGQIYGSYLDNLKGQEAGLLGELKKETGVSDLNTATLDTAGLKDKITDALMRKATDTAALLAGGGDSCSTDPATRLQRTAAQARHLADSAGRIYQRALKRYQQLVALEQQGRRYYALLDQYRNTAYFDSTIGYDKLKDLDNADASTYKQLAKSAADLLPEGKAKKAITGLTSLDVGIFPKETSRYTMAGQQLKGLDAGYDLGFCQVAGTVGSTEFIGRDGSLDKYTAYSGRALFQVAKKQKVTLIYYGYSPSKKALNTNDQDTFFRSVDIAYPTFQKPVHIVSATYGGTITKYVTAEAEVATSFRQGSGERIGERLDADHIAWHASAEGHIPKSTVNVQAGYEHAGREFENSTLPLNTAGTDRLQLAAKGDFFKSFVTVGLEYNHIEQHNLAATGNNNRWGFEVSTHSKRYPSVSLSYKPYTTFRSYTDTLTIPQRPVLGAVWTGRGSYQIKRKGGISWRFSAVFNKSTAELDTSRYGSDLLQLSAIYATPKYMVMASGGSMEQTANGQATDVAAHVQTTFVMMSGSYTLSRQASVSGGYDLGYAPFGWSKVGVNGGWSYSFSKVPFAVRLTGRWSKYRLSDPGGWQSVYGGSVDVVWRFKMKLNKS